MKKLLALITLVCVLPSARADEGMWTFNRFPKERLKQKYGFSPDDKWLDHVRLGSARLARGCSGSFVSPDGLVLTNHHCAHPCIEEISTAEKDYVKSGFYARTPGEEARCPAVEINQLVEISDVTDRLAQATRGLADQAYNQARKAEMSRIEKACATSDKLRCEVVTLYQGGAYNLYKYRRFQDVRLVFAPEFAIAFFGGDPDNFMFPRYDLDLSFLRVYEDGKPARMEHSFPFSPAGARENELTFVTGHPGGTDRALTVAQLEFQRDVTLPARLLRIAEFRGLLVEFGRRGAEEKRISSKDLFYLENAFKALRGRHAALLDHVFFEAKAADEKALRAQIAADPERQKKYGGAWEAIARALGEQRQIFKLLINLELVGYLSGRLFQMGRALVRAADELPKPNEQRLRELTDGALPEVKQELFSPAPIHDALEVRKLTFWLTKLREDLGADHPAVRKILGRESPEEMANRLVKGTRLRDVAVRRQLWDGGRAAIAASDDPVIQLMRLLDPDARAVRQRYEDQVEAVVKKSSELIARARFEVRGMNDAPDATFTLRLSYGQVKGYPEGGQMVSPITTLGGAFDRATGRPPFDLPESWIKARASLDLAKPLNFCSTNDIIGGNSGSPVLDREAQVVGLIFDGNIYSLGGDFGFEESKNRAVAVSSVGIVEALAKIYHADRLVEELRRKR